LTSFVWHTTIVADNLWYASEDIFGAPNLTAPQTLGLDPPLLMIRVSVWYFDECVGLGLQEEK